MWSWSCFIEDRFLSRQRQNYSIQFPQHCWILHSYMLKKWTWSRMVDLCGGNTGDLLKRHFFRIALESRSRMHDWLIVAVAAADIHSISIWVNLCFASGSLRDPLERLSSKFVFDRTSGKITLFYVCPVTIFPLVCLSTKPSVAQLKYGNNSKIKALTNKNQRNATNYNRCQRERAF